MSVNIIDFFCIYNFIYLGFSTVLLFKLDEPREEPSIFQLYSEPVLVIDEFYVIPNDVHLTPDEDAIFKLPKKQNLKRNSGRRHKPDGRIRLLKNVVEESH